MVRTQWRTQLSIPTSELEVGMDHLTPDIMKAMNTLSSLYADMKHLGSSEKAKNNSWFFKTGTGEYGEGDTFCGLTVPQCRSLAKKYRHLPLEDIDALLHSPIHEARLIALIMAVTRFETNQEEQKDIYDWYLANTRWINNWDLVDTSAHKIVGAYLDKKPKDILLKLARSQSIWERRIAAIATFWFIKNGDYTPSLAVAEILLHDPHDLIHKAVGWMLREVGNKARETEESFLRKHYKSMPRTMLRYAIEKFEEPRRQAYLKGSI